MSQSNIVPSILGLRHQKSDRSAMIYDSILSYMLCLLNFYLPTLNLTKIPIICAFCIYLSDFYAYYKLQTDFSNVIKEIFVIR